MGRHAGWIALHSWLGGGAQAVLLPEIPFRMDKWVQLIKQRIHAGFGSTMIVVAEGVKAQRSRGGSSARNKPNYALRAKCGLAASFERLAKQLETLTGQEALSVELDHLQ